jgi:cell shape-determining protein MreC
MSHLNLTAALGTFSVDFNWSRKEVYKVELRANDDIEPGDQITVRKGSRVPVGRVESVNAKDGYFLVIVNFKVNHIDIGRKIERVA